MVDSALSAPSQGVSRPTPQTAQSIAQPSPSTIDPFTGQTSEQLYPLQFNQQIQAKQYQEQGGNVPPSNPFVGAPYGGAISPEQQAVIDMFAPADVYQKQSDAHMPYEQRPLYARAPQNHTGPMDVLTQYPFISDKGVSDMSQFWPEYNWDTSGAPQQNMNKFQQNFNDLIQKGLLDYQLSGVQRTPYMDGPNAPAARKLFKPKITPRYAEEQLIQNLFN